MLAPSTFPFSMALGVSPAPAPPPPSTVPVRALPFCWRVKPWLAPPPNPPPPNPAAAATGAGLHRPVMPSPAGTARSQTAAWGRSFTALEVMVTLAGVNPGELASTVMAPAALVDCTRVMQRPEKALRELLLSDSWLGGWPL